MSAELGKTVLVAKEKFKNGLTRSYEHRLKVLQQLKKFLEEDKESIITSIVKDVRKHREEADLEVTLSLGHINYLIGNLKAWMKPHKPEKRLLDILDDAYVYPEPYGVVLIISAWNVPLLSILPAAGAIAAGNCVVIKPSHNSPSFGKMLLQLLPNYINSDCYAVVLGGIEETQALLKQRFDYIFYTGSADVGKIVHLAANKYLTPTTLKLGGKNPVYVDSSIDMETAARRIMWGKVFNSGQACVAADYLLCSKEVEAEFIKFASKALNEFFKDLVRSCPVINSTHFERLLKLMNGLKIAVGGRSIETGYYIEPTIVVDVDPNDPIMQEEVFGPILPIISVNSFEEAVDFINTREKPITVHVFTTNSLVKKFFLNNTSSGALMINDVFMNLTYPTLPFSGVGYSGIGTYSGESSFRTFVHEKSVLEKPLLGALEFCNQLRYPPYSEQKSYIGSYYSKYGQCLSLSSTVYVISVIASCMVGYFCL